MWWGSTATLGALRASFLPLVQAATYITEVGRRGEPRRLMAPMVRRAVTGATTGTPRVPLHHRPARVAVLDSDPGFVSEMTAALPPRWQVRPFLSADSCLNHLQQEPPLWEADFWAQQELVGLWQLGAPLIPLVLRYWANTPERCALTSVLVVEQLMPGMDGLDMLQDLADWPGAAVLMSGSFDENIATDAFNSGLIDQYVVKQHSTVRDDLIEVVDDLLARPNSRAHEIWSATLTPEQSELLRQPSIAHDLGAYLRASFVEWVVIGDPLGVLALDAKGRTHWLQLNTREQLAALADQSEQHGMSRADADDVRAGRKLSNIALQRALSLDDCRAVPAFQVGEQPGLLAGITRIAVKAGLHNTLRQHEWLAHVRPGNRQPF